MAGLKIESYDPVDMSLLSSDVTGVDFGATIKGQHSSNVVAIRPVADGITLSAIGLFLQDAAGLNHTQFGNFISETPYTGITPGNAYLSDFFIEVTGISDASMLGIYSDYGILYDAGSPEYTWMDAEAGSTETVGSATVNFRFVFEYT